MTNARRTRNDDTAGRGAPRPRVAPWWRGRWARAAALTAVVGVAGFAGWWTWHLGWGERLGGEIAARSVALTSGLGFRVREVLVEGRYETDAAALRQALGVERGTPILGIDPGEARRRIEALPWVKSASVERQLPDTVIVRIRERTAMAMWQNGGRYHLIDENGTAIDDPRLERFAGLLLVVGEDAPAHAADLLDTLSTEPQLMVRVKAAVRVGGRRWNLRLDNGIDVRLPEQGSADAWARLAESERLHKVLARDISEVDLRLPDRLVLRRARGADEHLVPKGRDT